MNAVEWIRKKRNGQELTADEIHSLIEGYTRGEVPDYQLSAWAMAVYYQGMSDRETSALTEALVSSGEQIDLSSIRGVTVDKHSTGGVGDTTTLVVAPLVAAEGIPVAKLSGRGLGHTGGTVDKLESIPGFATEMTNQQFLDQVNQTSIAIMGQTANLTPADKKMYALRDVTATVDSIPLIASSVMSKKIAAGAQAIVLDVKTGAGAFMKEEQQAVLLARKMVAIGREVGRTTVAIVSDMNQPLGRAVGNGLEVKEAIETLQGNGPKDLTELSLRLAAQMVVLGEGASSIAEAEQRLRDSLRTGKAWCKLREFVTAQQGDPEWLEQPERMLSPITKPVLAQRTGWVQSIHAEEVGLCAMYLGAGRATKQDKIDHGVGIWLHKKIGEQVTAGEPLATLYLRSEEPVTAVEDRLLRAFTISAQVSTSPPLIRKMITD